MESACVTSLDFDETGGFLAAGYSDGTVSVYCRPKNGTKFKVYVRFISHEAEIVKVKWCKGISCNLLLLSSDVNATKLWKISRSFSGNTCADDDNEHLFSNVKIVLRRVFSQAPPQGSTSILNTHSLSLNSDGEIFLTADELRIYLWNLQSGGKECFSVLDLAAELQSLQMLTEVMRTATFHPQHCHLLVYGTSTGAVRMCDLRASALCEGLGLPLPPAVPSTSTKKNPLNEYMVGISDLAFDPSGHHLAARDYGGVTLWDMRASHQYLSRYSVLPSCRDKLMSHLYDRYEIGAPLEQFKCCFSRSQSNSSLNLITGTYDDRCVLWDVTSASSPPSDISPRHKTIHVARPKPAYNHNNHSTAPILDFPDFADDLRTQPNPLTKRRKFSQLGSDKRRPSNSGRGGDSNSGEVVDIFPDDYQSFSEPPNPSTYGNNRIYNNSNEEDEDDRRSVPLEIHTHHDTYYQNRSNGLGRDASDYFGMDYGGETKFTHGSGFYSPAGDCTEEDGVLGVYSATPEFLAVVPFSNSYISYFTGDEDGDGQEETGDSQMSPLAFSSKVTAIAVDQQGELLSMSARGSLFVYNITR